MTPVRPDARHGRRLAYPPAKQVPADRPRRTARDLGAKAVAWAEAFVGVTQELDTDHTGRKPSEREPLSGAQQELELEAARVEEGLTEDRGVKRHDLYRDARLLARTWSTISSLEIAPWPSWRRASVCCKRRARPTSKRSSDFSASIGTW